MRSAASAGGESFGYEPTRAEALGLLEQTGWQATELATAHDLAERHLGDTALATRLTREALLITATRPG